MLEKIVTLSKLFASAIAIAIAILASQCHAFSPPCTLLHHDNVNQSSRDYSYKAITDSALKNAISDEREGSMAAATKELGQVPYGETSRKYRRTVFRHKDWVAHRSSETQILNNLQSMFTSGVIRQLKPQVTAVSAISVLMLTWNWVATTSEAGPISLDGIHLPVLALPPIPFTLSSPALGLLLVFRTNAAYFRWMSARDSWARITQHAKNLVRMGVVFSSDLDAVDEFSKVVWLYCRTVMNKLSSPSEDEEVYLKEVRDIFQDSAIAEKIVSSPDRVISAWRELSIQLHALPTADPKSLIETDKSIIILGDSTSMCEKIYSSPVPLVYTRHTARFLSLWALLLPFALYSSFYSVGLAWAVLPAAAIMAFFFFGVDELAMQLEEPFSILPLQVFCDEVMEANKIMLGKDEASLD